MVVKIDFFFKTDIKIQMCLIGTIGKGPAIRENSLVSHGKIKIIIYANLPLSKCNVNKWQLYGSASKT